MPEKEIRVEPCVGHMHDCGKWKVLIDGRVDAWRPSREEAQAHADTVKGRAS